MILPVRFARGLQWALGILFTAWAFDAIPPRLCADEQAIRLIEDLDGAVKRDATSPDRPVVEVWLGGSDITTDDLAC